MTFTTQPESFSSHTDRKAITNTGQLHGDILYRTEYSITITLTKLNDDYVQYMYNHVYVQ